MIPYYVSSIKVANVVNIVYRRYAMKNKLTRLQMFYLDFLIRNKFTGSFRTCDVVPDGLSYLQARQYLLLLLKNGYLSRDDKLWSLTPFAYSVYAEIQKLIRSRLHSPFRWK